jgi:hypothetical protein
MQRLSKPEGTRDPAVGRSRRGPSSFITRPAGDEPGHRDAKRRNWKIMLVP